MNRSFLKYALCAIGAAGLLGLAGGCATSTPLDEPTVESRTPVAPGGAAGSSGSGANAAGTAQSGVSTVDLSKSPTGGDAAAMANRIVYFDYDSFTVKEEFRPMLEATARQLSANRSMRMVAEGHTDERGGSEYNLALGQKRAESVVKTLVLLGALDGQLEAVSFGKERPVVVGGDESGWAKNRRVELKAK